MKWYESEVPANEQTIEEIQQRLGVRFPIDYKRVAKTSHGEPPTPNTIDFGMYKEKVVGCLLSFDNSSPINFLHVYGSLKKHLPLKVIPFAKDPFGNMYCFDYRDSEEPTIVYWNHESGSITHVCDTFSKMESMLYELDWDDDDDE
ncbi:SMI1/KNR4 family protein [Desmospora profundinema]|uniref:Knr4/Smi1-like domain-containing protein n=1 Tax=Desmospora profundinema TaxID=1571184 RepID=A0ABU1IH31_9BACL|nr:SMI1/KNR4 family protein [Desmospora profundinema]MDR6224016.1 hypothetical protein [Desmospora profundinema]